MPGVAAEVSPLAVLHARQLRGPCGLEHDERGSQGRASNLPSAS